MLSVLATLLILDQRVGVPIFPSSISVIFSFSLLYRPGDGGDDKLEDGYVRVGKLSAPDDIMELPLELDGTFTLSTVLSHFPNAIGLKWRAGSGAWRGLRAVDNIFDPPKSGWKDTVYYVTENDQAARKTDSSSSQRSMPAPPSGNVYLQDMAVLDLAWSTTSAELEQYFNDRCGDVVFCEVKTDRETGKSRGFGFIRFSSEDAARRAADGEHVIGGRVVEVKPKKVTPMKLFVGRLPDGTTRDALHDYFSKFGELSDTYVPSPFKGFGFVTFVSDVVGQHVISGDHIMGGNRLNVTRGEESKSFNRRRQDNNGGGGRGGGDRYQHRDRDHRDHGDSRDSSSYRSRDRSPHHSGGRSGRGHGGGENQDLKSKLMQFLQSQ